MEEELEIMSDPVKVVEGIRANAGSIDTSNDRISNKVKRVRKDCVFSCGKVLPTKVESADSAPRGASHRYLGGFA